MSIGTEKIEALLEDIKELVVVAKKIKEDGKVDVSDLAHAVGLLPKLPKIIEDVKAVSEAIEEAKDLDVAEIVGLVQKVSSLIKDIEKV